MRELTLRLFGCMVVVLVFVAGCFQTCFREVVSFVKSRGGGTPCSLSGPPCHRKRGPRKTRQWLSVNALFPATANRRYRKQATVWFLGRRCRLSWNSLIDFIQMWQMTSCWWPRASTPCSQPSKWRHKTSCRSDGRTRLRAPRRWAPHARGHATTPARRSERSWTRPRSTCTWPTGGTACCSIFSAPGFSRWLVTGRGSKGQTEVRAMIFRCTFVVFRKTIVLLLKPGHLSRSPPPTSPPPSTTTTITRNHHHHYHYHHHCHHRHHHGHDRHYCYYYCSCCIMSMVKTTTTMMMMTANIVIIIFLSSASVWRFPVPVFPPGLRGARGDRVSGRGASPTFPAVVTFLRCCLLICLLHNSSFATPSLTRASLPSPPQVFQQTLDLLSRHDVITVESGMVTTLQESHCEFACHLWRPLLTAYWVRPDHTKLKNVHSPNLWKRNVWSEVVRIGGTIIFHPVKLWKAKFFILCDVISLVRLQEKFKMDHSWEWKG